MTRIANQGNAMPRQARKSKKAVRTTVSKLEQRRQEVRRRRRIAKRKAKEARRLLKEAKKVAKRAKAELQALGKKLKKLLAGAGHDVKPARRSRRQVRRAAAPRARARVAKN
jgi:chromosome segregation ATPase